LAGIAIPRFLEATASARGAKIVADMRTIESAAYVYYAKHSEYPGDESALGEMIQGGWPKPPVGKATIASTAKKDVFTTLNLADTDAYVFHNAEADASGSNGKSTGWCTLKKKYVYDFVGATTSEEVK